MWSGEQNVYIIFFNSISCLRVNHGLLLLLSLLTNISLPSHPPLSHTSHYPSYQTLPYSVSHTHTFTHTYTCAQQTHLYTHSHTQRTHAQCTHIHTHLHTLTHIHTYTPSLPSTGGHILLWSDVTCCGELLGTLNWHHQQIRAT